jgi:hypothetical protein
MGSSSVPLLLLAALSSALSASASEPAPQPLPASAAHWCWKAVDGDLGKQDTGLMTLSPTVATRGAEHLWLAWAEEHAMSIRRHVAGGWEPIPGPGAEGEEVHEAVLRLDASGVPVLAWRTSDDEGNSLLSVSRWSGTRWERLGEPLRAGSSPMLHLGTTVLALDARGRPVVAWQEQQDFGPRSLHAAQWTGSAWARLGKRVASGSKRSSLAPSVALDERGDVWLAWLWGPQGRAHVRVARWSGTAWRDVGGSTRGHLRRKGTAGAPQLQPAPGGGAVLAWEEWDGKETWSVELARLRGTTWEPLSPLPSAPPGKSRAGTPALMLLADGQPVVAWSDRDEATQLFHLYIQRLTPDGWQWLFQGLHLDEGQSDARDIQLLPTPDGGFLALWDEAGKGDRRLRLLRAHPCAQGETPAPLPAMVSLESFWPASVEEAVDRIVSELDEASKARVRETPREKLSQFHPGWGMGIRNRFGLWQGNTRLLKSCGGEPLHPDTCSGVIIEAVWRRLQGEGPTPAPDAGP